MLPCPLCGAAPAPGYTHPHTVCASCLARTTDSAGRSVVLATGESHDQGVYATYTETGELYGPFAPYELPVWIAGVHCVAFYRRFGVHVRPVRQPHL